MKRVTVSTHNTAEQPAVSAENVEVFRQVWCGDKGFVCRWAYTSSPSVSPSCRTRSDWKRFTFSDRELAGGFSVVSPSPSEDSGGMEILVAVMLEVSRLVTAFRFLQ